MMLHSYLTVSGYGEKEIDIEKSRFIAYVKEASTEQEAIDFIEKIKKQHWNASHNCSAYLIGEKDDYQKANDDGEPSGTAGKPMLELLKKIGLKDTVVVVTRYFGGVKLGAGGLIRAYGQAAKEGVIAAGVIKRQLHRQILVTVDYTWHGKLQNECMNKEITIADTQFLEKVTMTILTPEKDHPHMLDYLTNLTNGQAELTVGDVVYVDEEVVLD